MKNVLILGASGQIARHVVNTLSKDKQVHMTLYLRHPKKLQDVSTGDATVVQADVLDHKKLSEAMKGQQIVYANLAGDVDKQAAAIIKAMKAEGVNRLIFIASLGIYQEVPGKFGKWNESMIGRYLVPYAAAAKEIENSGVDYTIVRPAWLTDYDESDYELTEKGELFKGTEVSRQSVADFVVTLIHHPDRHVNASVGINKPGTDGDKPAFY